MKTIAVILAIAFIYSSALNYEQDKRIQKLQRFIDDCRHTYQSLNSNLPGGPVGPGTCVWYEPK